MNKIYQTTLPLLAAIFLAATPRVKAQFDSGSNKHSIEFSISPSLSRLAYKSTENSSKGNLSLGVGLGYTYHLNERWGVGLGLKYQPFSATYQNTGYQATSAQFSEPNGNQYTITQTLDNEEKQSVNYLMLPLMANYKHPLTSKLAIKASVGMAYAFALNEKLEVTSGSISRTAYFPNADLTIDKLPEQTLGVFDDYINMTSERQFNNTILGMGELGAEYVLNKRWLLSAGINATVGGDIKNLAAPIIEQQSYSGVTASNHVGTVKPVSVGLSVGLVYHFSKKTPKPVPAIISNPVVVPPAAKPSPEPIIEPAPEVIVKETIEMPTPTPLENLQVEVRKFNSSEEVQFKFNLKDPQEETKKKLEQLVRLNNETKVETVIIGHACDIGSSQVNHRIGLERANSVKQYLVEQGISPEKIEVQSAGEASPKYPNDSPENRAKNRRVEIVVK